MAWGVACASAAGAPRRAGPQTIRWLCDEVYPKAEKIVLVQVNLNTHTPASLYGEFEPCEALRLKQRVEWHYCFTPPHGAHPNGHERQVKLRILEFPALAASMGEYDHPPTSS